MDVQSIVIDPVLEALGPPYESDEARVLLMAIGLTESNFRARLQVPVAHARGFWQFEKNGGCAEFELAKELALFRKVATSWGFATTRAATWTAIGAGADHLACLMARGLLWLDPSRLPPVGDVDAAYAYYLRRWRPGKPSPVRFRSAYAKVGPLA
jgi:hypothetical protein